MTFKSDNTISVTEEKPSRKLTNKEKIDAWINDQYQHPVESLHTIDEVLDWFKKNKIEYGFHYPKSINQIEALKKYFKKKKFINAEKLADQGISLPIDPNLSLKNQSFIVKTLNSF